MTPWNVEACRKQSTSESVTDIDNITETESDECSTTAISETISSPEESETRYARERNRGQGSVYRANPYFMSQAAFFQQPVTEQFSSRNKIVSFIEKDLFLLGHHETGCFRNAAHAVEVTSPYHIFTRMVDDIKFEGSDVTVDLAEELGALRQKFGQFVRRVVIENETQGTFLAQLLLFHESRYFIGRMDQEKRKALSQRATSKKAKTGPKPKGAKKSRTVRKKRSGRDKFILAIKKPKYAYCYGSPRSIHFNLKKL